AGAWLIVAGALLRAATALPGAPAALRGLSGRLWGAAVAGYALMGAAIVLDGGFFSAGRHLAAVGAMGLAIYAVLCIAGRMHCGLPLDERPWVPAGAWLIVAGALLRAATALPGAPAALLGLSGLLWGAAFALYAWRMASLFLAPRADGGRGCEGILVH
ncbi:MAG: NnrS family protein, partial [Rubrivivax sp.]|nr:NnrS family protein [Rubrivivax sp.]